MSKKSQVERLSQIRIELRLPLESYFFGVYISFLVTILGKTSSGTEEEYIMNEIHACHSLNSVGESNSVVSHKSQRMSKSSIASASDLYAAVYSYLMVSFVITGCAS